MRILAVSLCLLVAPAAAAERTHSHHGYGPQVDRVIRQYDGGATWDLMLYGKVLSPHARVHGHTKDCGCQNHENEDNNDDFSND